MKRVTSQENMSLTYPNWFDRNKAIQLTKLCRRLIINRTEKLNYERRKTHLETGTCFCFTHFKPLKLVIDCLPKVLK